MCIKKADPEIDRLRARRPMSDREDAHMLAWANVRPEPEPPDAGPRLHPARIQIPESLRRQWEALAG